MVPGIGYGLGTANFNNDTAELVELVKTAVKVGYRHLDGAEAYNVRLRARPRSRTCWLTVWTRRTRRERDSIPLLCSGADISVDRSSLGKAIAACGVPREELFGAYNVARSRGLRRGLTCCSYSVTTKSGPGLKDIPKSFEQSLEKLGLDHVDLYLIHWPYDFPKPGYPTIQEAWKHMEAIKDSGRAKSIGVSNFRVRDLEKILNMSDLKHKPTVNQIEFHPFMYKAGEELYQYRMSSSQPLRCEPV